jgi:hypothetical protein
MQKSGTTDGLVRPPLRSPGLGGPQLGANQLRPPALSVTFLSVSHCTALPGITRLRPDGRVNSPGAIMVIRKKKHRSKGRASGEARCKEPSQGRTGVGLGAGGESACPWIGQRIR